MARKLYLANMIAKTHDPVTGNGFNVSFLRDQTTY